MSSHDIEDLQNELQETKEQLEHYRFSSQSFERRVLDLQMELLKKDDEMKVLKGRYEQSLDGKRSVSEGLEGEEEPIVMRKLFVGGLPQNATDLTLHEYFSQYGDVSDAMVMKDLTTKKSRGFGFVVFARSFMADAAQAARPHRILERDVDTKRAIPKTFESTVITPKTASIQSNRVFIGGLKSTTIVETVQEYFETFGIVESVKIMEDAKTKKSRGFAYVTFADSDVADKVILQKFHVIDLRRCEVKPAFSKIAKPRNSEEQCESFPAGLNQYQQQLFQGFDQVGADYPNMHPYFHHHPYYESAGGFMRSSPYHCCSHSSPASPLQPMVKRRIHSDQESTSVEKDSCSSMEQMWKTYSEQYARAMGEQSSHGQQPSSFRPLRNQTSYFPRHQKPY